MQNKFNQLNQDLESMSEQGICLALSGGTDSSLLLYLLKDLNLTAVTFNSPFITDEEINFTVDLCKKYNVKQEIININPLEDKNIINNPKNRCYFCKRKFFTLLKEYARKNNLKYSIDGTNYDDLNVLRPGIKALNELGILSPFAKYGINKKEIREYAKKLDLDFYNKPSEPCSATRFPYNTILDVNKIKLVQKNEKYLKNLGFKSVRFRLHNDIARIEIDKNYFEEFIDKKDDIINNLKSDNIKYITLDIEGIRTGSMDI